MTLLTEGHPAQEVREIRKLPTRGPAQLLHIPT